MSTMTEIRVAARDRLRTVQDAYGADRPLSALASLVTIYTGVVAALVTVAHRRQRLPERISAADLALYSVATHKLARLVAKDPIASPFRAPFTRLEGLSGPAELHEEVIGDGWRHAVGELLTCPFCLGQWVGTAFVFGGVLAPRATRVVAATFVVHAASDALQHGSRALERATAEEATAEVATAEVAT
jgi:hypothetical protein